MLFHYESLDEHEASVVAQTDELRQALRWQLHEPRRWAGSLRRLSFARNLRGSNSIEGFDAALDDAAAVAAGEDPLDASQETTQALAGYRDALTYVLQLADEPDFTYSEQLLKSLHFMMTSYSLRNRPGRWRSGPIFVHDDRSGDIVHEGADVSEVPTLMHELVGQMGGESTDLPMIARAGLAHLNLAMIHPFRDGNGRMARCAQSLMLAREGVLAPVFVSIEEYLGNHTAEYYAVLALVGGGSWQPARDTKPWVRFTLTAHLRQARTLQTRIRDSELLWTRLEQVARDGRLPERCINAMFDAALGLRVRRATYRSAIADNEPISVQTATRDLKALVDQGYLQPKGEKRGRVYVASTELTRLLDDIVGRRSRQGDADPFAPAAP